MKPLRDHALNRAAAVPPDADEANRPPHTQVAKMRMRISHLAAELRALPPDDRTALMEHAKEKLFTP